MEFLDVYNLNKEKTGRIVSRENVFENILQEERILLVHACIFNAEGKMLLQRRQLTKDRYPGLWDVSAGGFVKAGEVSAEAVSREISEELGLIFEQKNIYFVYCEPFGPVLDDFYAVFSDVGLDMLKLQQQEVMGAEWYEREKVVEMINNGTMVDYPVPLIERMFSFAEGQRYISD